MAEFSVLTQPWIPVKRTDGTQEEVGIWNVLINAHQYVGLCCESPLEEYSIQRLLIAFLMDAYQPQTYRDRRTLYRKGCFDPDILQNYIELCKQEGASFDLFDENRPFMQARYNEASDKKQKKPVSSIIHTASSGNNHIHFEHHFENEYKLTYAQALRAMLASYVFCASGGRGYSPSVNGKPCNYYLTFGGTLFHTLILNALSKLECENIPWDTPPVAWRNPDEIIPQSEYSTVSILSAFTWQPRRITLISNGSEITEVFYQPGKKCSDIKRWKEPHAALTLSEKEPTWKPITPKSGRALWRDVGTIVAANEATMAHYRPPLASLTYHQITSESHQLIPLWVTGIVTEQATKFELQEDTLYIPAAILSEPELGEQLRHDMQQCEQVATEIFIQYKAISTAIATQLQEQFFIACHRFLFTEYLPNLASLDICTDGWQNQSNTLFAQGLTLVVKELQNQTSRYVGTSGRNLILLTQCNHAFHKAYRKIIKKG